MKIGITGQQGFIGKHLFNYLGLQDGVELVSFDKKYFSDSTQLESFVKECDTIVHLAAMNRHEDPQVIYDTNVELVRSIVNACQATNSNPHILFSSSTQEERENLYGQSKKDGRIIFEEWAEKNNGIATGMLIPNVFGPFGKPYYNSVVATFCHQVIKQEEPIIHVDGNMKLIYINELIEEIFQLIKNKTAGKVEIPHYHELKVTELLGKLNSYYAQYIEKGVFPTLDNPLDLALFNSFRCYIPHDHYPVLFTKHTDDRGSFVEIVRANTSGQFSFSTTKPGITRGNHFHTRKAERFAVIKGKARIQLRKMDTDEVIDYTIDGENPAYVDMPIWYTHNITNIGDEELITLFWINEPYDQENPDTYFVNV